MEPYLDEKNNPWIELDLGLDMNAKVKCLIDTGFSGGIALPNYYFSLFQNKIPFSTESYEFANGEQKEFKLYTAYVRIQRRKIEVKVLFIENHIPLVGINFLKHFNLTLDIPNHTIALTPKSRKKPS